MTSKKSVEQIYKEVERGLLRSTFRSIFWAVMDAKKAEGFSLKMLSDRLGVNKSVVSRWFTRDQNWEINTIADIAVGLEITLHIVAIDNQTGRNFPAVGDFSCKPQDEDINYVVSGTPPDKYSIQSVDVEDYVNVS